MTQLIQRRIALAAAWSIACSAPLAAGTLFEDDFENPVISGYGQGITPEIWIRSSQGFNSGFHGLINKDTEEFSAPVGNEQSYAFRYSNTGITTAGELLGPPLSSGGGYEVAFDVVRDDGGNAGTPYSAQLVAFAEGAARDDCRSTPAGSAVLASASGNAPANGTFSRVVFIFFPNDTTHAAHFGKDLGIRFKGAITSSIIDNVTFRAIPSPAAGLGLVGTTPADEASQILTFTPLRAVFNKNIAAATGNIILRDLTNLLEPVDYPVSVTDPRVSISGVLLEIDARDVLQYGKDYAVLIEADTLIQTPGGAPFAGIADDTVWNFTTADGDFLFFSISQLKDHITGAITLTAAEIEIIKLNLDKVVGRYAESSESISALFDLIETYDTVLGPLFVARGLPDRDDVINDLHWTIYNVMQTIMDRIYTAETLAAHESLLDGFKFGSHTNFPGPCAPPADPLESHTVAINGSFPRTFGRDTQQWTLPARKPTGTYLAPGTIATVTVPPALVNAGYLVRVNAHSWNLSGRKPIKRLERASRTYPLTAGTIKVASPYGGGIYIEVPIGSDAGVVDVTVTGAVRAPYFSAKSFHQTTAAEWETERAHPAPWADFQSEKFMTQVPRNWIYNHPAPSRMLADWDDAMDAINSLMGFPLDRGKETMYPQVDVITRSSVFAPGYPAVNVTGNPGANSYGGYRNNYIVRGPGASPTAAHIEFHEQGHAYFFPKFTGENESTVNFLQAAVLHRKFGYGIDDAHRGSLGFTNSFRTLDDTAVAWMTSFNFSPRDSAMDSGEKSYQLKGHAKFMDIVRLFGWQGLDDYWRSFMQDDANDISYGTGTDDLLLRLSRNVGRDIRPLFHFWGVHPRNPSALAAALAAENIPPSTEIRDLLLKYKSLVPADNAAFRTWALNWWGTVPSPSALWTETEHARQWDQNDYFTSYNRIQQRAEITINEEYIEACAEQVQDRVQGLVDLYFPDGISPDPMTFALAPTAVDATTIGMVATTATAPEGPVQYYFENVTNATNSGWTMNPSWSQTGLASGTSYGFRVKARDGAAVPEETGWSATIDATATLDGDITPPSPDPMTFASAPAAVDEVSIMMTATAATDINGVEFYFENTAGDGNDSGWQSSPDYTDTNLSPATQYSYRVRARDGSGNTGGWSAAVEATTESPASAPPAIVSLDPADGATGIAAGADLVVTFDREITVGTGLITIRNLTNATQFTIDVTDVSQVSVSGEILTINPAADLANGKNYAIRIAATAIKGAAENFHPGVLDDTTWNFTTIALPPGLIYEPFADADANLSGNTPGFGLAGTWTSGGMVAATPGLNFGSLPVTGGKATKPSGTGGASASAVIASPLGAGGLLADGKTLWFSFLYERPAGAGTNDQAAFAIGDAAVTGGLNNGMGTGNNGFGVALDRSQRVQAAYWSNGARNIAGPTTTMISAGATALVVGKLVWNANGAQPDILEIYLPGTNLVLPDTPQATISFTLNQSTFDTISFGGKNTESPTIDEIRFGATYEAVIGQGASDIEPPGSATHFVISPINSPVTVGTAINGITITARDISGATATGFTGTVTFGGTGGFSGTSAAFVAGVLGDVSVVPALAGENLTLTATDGGGRTGSVMIATIHPATTVYQTWSGGASFDADANNDGIANGMAWMLGAAGPSAAGPVLLPAASESGGKLVLDFRCLTSSARGAATLKVQFSNDIGSTDSWIAYQAEVPDENGTVNGVIFNITADPDPAFINVRAEIPAQPGTRIFSRLAAEP